MTGAGTAATLGYPDYGLLTMSEMADNAGRIVASVSALVIADADTGYGNEKIRRSRKSVVIWIRKKRSASTIT